MALQLWATLNGQPVGDGGPVFTTTEAEIVMTELNQFSPSRVTLPAADERVILAMAPYTLLEIVQDDVGTIGYGYVLNPEQQITDRDEHTVTLSLDPLTVECTWRRTRRGWTAANWLSVIAQRLGALTPGWSGRIVDNDLQVSVNLNNPTALGGFLQTAQEFAQFARQGVDATGVPTRALEMGQFGAAPTMWLTAPNGGDAAAMHNNDLIRLVASVDRQPNDVRDLINVCVPFGGGSSSDTLVTLERLWRILFDPTYPNYSRWGTDADSIARTGLPSLFPEYNPMYPIGDPELPFGQRSVTLDGHYDYPVYDLASYRLYGYKEGEYIDSSLTYADNSVANQELTARALYVAATTQFKRYGHPHHTFTCTAEGRGRPTRAGDLIAVDYQRVSVSDTGAVVEMNVTDNLRVMQVVRSFQGDNPPVDTYTLSNLGRFDNDDATQAADVQRQMVALQLNQGTSLAPLPVNDRGNVDALHPLVVHVSVPKTLFRWQRCNLRVDFQPYTATSTTAENPNGTPVISADVEVLIPTPNGLTAQSAPLLNAPTHYHRVPVAPGGFPLTVSSTPTTIQPDRYVTVGGDGTDGMTLEANGGHSGTLKTGFELFNVDLTPTKHPHPVAAAGDTVAHIPAGQRIAALPQHTHPVDQRIPDGPLPVSCLVDVNGEYLSSGLTLLSGTRDLSGAFTSSFEVDDISAMLNGIAGDLTITLHAGTNGSNPYGVGMFVLSATFFGEFGGLTSTVRAE